MLQAQSLRNTNKASSILKNSPLSPQLSVAGNMEDIEDLLVGGGAALPGFRLPITAAVGINPTKSKKNTNNNSKSSLLQNSSTNQVPGTQVSIFYYVYICLFYAVFSH